MGKNRKCSPSALFAVAVVVIIPITICGMVFWLITGSIHTALLVVGLDLAVAIGAFLKRRASRLRSTDLLHDETIISEIPASHIIARPELKYSWILKYIAPLTWWGHLLLSLSKLQGVSVLEYECLPGILYLTTHRLVFVRRTFRVSASPYSILLPVILGCYCYSTFFGLTNFLVVETPTRRDRFHFLLVRQWEHTIWDHVTRLAPEQRFSIFRTYLNHNGVSTTLTNHAGVSTTLTNSQLLLIVDAELKRIETMHHNINPCGQASDLIASLMDIASLSNAFREL